MRMQPLNRLGMSLKILALKILALKILALKILALKIRLLTVMGLRLRGNTLGPRFFGQSGLPRIEGGGRITIAQRVKQKRHGAAAAAGVGPGTLLDIGARSFFNAGIEVERDKLLTIREHRRIGQRCAAPDASYHPLHEPQSAVARAQGDDAAGSEHWRSRNHRGRLGRFCQWVPAQGVAGQSGGAREARARRRRVGAAMMTAFIRQAKGTAPAWN